MLSTKWGLRDCNPKGDTQKFFNVHLKSTKKCEYKNWTDPVYVCMIQNGPDVNWSSFWTTSVVRCENRGNCVTSEYQTVVLQVKVKVFNQMYSFICTNRISNLFRRF
jgi:hypothetical protein